MARKYTYECDGCGHAVTNGNGEIPQTWADITVQASRFTNWRSGGSAVQESKSLLCSHCQVRMAEQINPKTWPRGKVEAA